MCGEQRGGGDRIRAPVGSPPRVRGTDGHGVWYFDRRRITPACAGNSGKYGPKFAQSWDHPRVCGEQISLILPFCSHKGSPPRVRGTDGHGVWYFDRRRITPACAGNSASVWSYRLWHSGSPPRVRGTGPNVPAFGDHAGITPACAGNSNFGSIGGKGK